MEPSFPSIEAKLTDGYTVDIQAGTHHLLADEPEIVGGANKGPDPYSLVMSGLAACTAMTMRMYAQRKSWSLEEVHVSITHNKIYAEECEHCMEPSGKVDRFERTISMKGDLDDSQRKRLLDIANKCPVHKTLVGNAVVDTIVA